MPTVSTITDEVMQLRIVATLRLPTSARPSTLARCLHIIRRPLLHPPPSPPPSVTPSPSIDMLSLLTSPSSTVSSSPVRPPPTLSSTLEQPITWSTTGTSFPTYCDSLNLCKSLSATAPSSRLHNQGHSIYHTSPWTTCSSSQVS